MTLLTIWTLSEAKNCESCRNGVTKDSCECPTKKETKALEDGSETYCCIDLKASKGFWDFDKLFTKLWKCIRSFGIEHPCSFTY